MSQKETMIIQGIYFNDFRITEQERKCYLVFTEAIIRKVTQK